MHSKLPWKATECLDVWIEDADGKLVAMFGDISWIGEEGMPETEEIMKGNAMLSVEACNNYHRLQSENKRLREALEGLMKSMEFKGQFNRTPDFVEAWKTAKTALSGEKYA